MDDPRKCIKIPLEMILHPTNREHVKNVIEDVVTRTNSITTKAYMILRLWVLTKYHGQVEIPEITKDVIRLAIKSVVIPARKASIPENEKLVEEFRNLFPIIQEDGSNLSYVFGYSITGILTAINNNCTQHFKAYVNRFVNSSFKHLYKDNSKLKTQVWKDTKKIKNDLFNNTTTCDPKYQEWLNAYRSKIIPNDIEKFIEYDLAKYPQKYLKYMIFMCLDLEAKGMKSFQFFPQQNKCVPRHVMLDTTALNMLLVKGRPKYEKARLYEYQEWSDFFKIPKKISIKNYVFDHMISTDGYSASVHFIHKEKVEEANLLKKKREQGRKDKKKESLKNLK